MPWSIRVHKHHEKPFWVINTDTGKVKGKCNTRAAAQRMLNLLRAVKHGWEPTGKKAKR